MQVAHFPLHTLPQAQAIIKQALEIAEEHDSPDVHQSIIFREACRLLGGRYTRPILEPAQVSSATLDLLRGINTGA